MITSAVSSRRRVCVVITARASYSRIRSALSAIDAHPDLDLQIVAGASAVLDRYGNAVRFIEADGFSVAARFYNIIEGENVITAAKSTGLGLVELSTVLSNLQPDIVVTIADRFETLATAVAAAYMNIPLAHVQGGEITGSIDEKVRHAVTKLADVHLVASEKAFERVVRMGEDISRVYLTGCPAIDLAAEASQLGPFPRQSNDLRQDNSRQDNLWNTLGGVGDDVDLSGDYLIVMQHPVTTEYDNAREQITQTLHAVAETGLLSLWFWPNVDAGSDGISKGIRAFREQHVLPGIRFLKHVDSIDFLRLALGSRCIVGNSSVALRECSFLGIPAVNVGTRQQGRDRGQNVIDVDYNRREIVEAIRRQFAQGRYPCDTLYGRGDAGPRIAQTLAQAPLSVDKQLVFPDRVSSDQVSNDRKTSAVKSHEPRETRFQRELIPPQPEHIDT